uniref:Plasmodium vivax Vir protein n=1 Tax=Parastrongyloides trichosuri TaxID=131310 RepID=A0A0N4ZWF5_PARTI
MIWFKNVIGISLFIITICEGLSYKNIISGCNSQCTLDDVEDFPCWVRNKEFFEKVLIGGFRNYISTQGKRYIVEDDPDFDIFTKESIESMNNVKRVGYVDEHKVIDKSVISKVVMVLMEDVKNLVSDTDFINNKSLPLDIVCPDGCEAKYDSYMWLSILSIVVNCIFVLSYFILMNIKEKLDLKEYSEKEYVIVQ